MVYLKYSRYDQDFNTANLKEVILCIKTFEKGSGLRINSEKTQ